MLFYSINIYAQTSTWSGGMSTITNGTGTESDPYWIENANHLAFMAHAVNNNISNYKTAYYRLTTNINLNNIEWTPIGSTDFSGNFDGENHNITNLSITNATDYAGLFGALSGGTLLNINVIGNINSTNYAGGIVGAANSNNDIGSLIINCSFSGSISAKIAGGIVGSFSGNYLTGEYGSPLGTRAVCTIKKCKNNGSIQAPHSGGIIGDGFIISVYDCYNKGNVSSITSSTVALESSGGIIGYLTVYTYSSYWGVNYYASYMYNCYNYGTITNSYSSCRGGILGYLNIWSTDYSSIFDCNNNHYLYTSCTNNNGYGTSQLASLMQSANFVNTLNAGSNVWVQDVTPYQNQGYPIIGDFVRISQIMDITANSVTLIGYVDSDINHTSLGFKYKKTGQNNYTITNFSDFSLCTINNLQYNSNYQIQAFTHKIGYDTIFSDIHTFHTANLPITITNASICQGETYFFMDSSFSITGIYPIVENDTIHQLNLTVYPLYNDTLDINVCNGESFTFNDTIFSSSCYHTFYFQSIHGCDSIVTLHLTVLPEYRPIITITIDTSICRGDSITLTADGASSYLWNTNAITQSITVSPYNTTRYIVTASNSSDCYIKDTVIVTVKALPSPSITGTTIFCDGNSSTLTASGGVSYLWNTGDTTYSIIVDTAGIYSVLATGVNGCRKEVQKNVTVRPLPNLSLNINDTSICLGESLLLIASGGSSYVWSSEQTSNSINVTPNSSTAYSITAYNSYNCSKSDTVNIIVNPVPILSCVGDTSICSGSSTNITIYGAENYLWSNGETSSTLSLNPSSSTQYTVIGTNSHLCSSSLSIPITVHQPTYTIDTIHSCNSYTWIDGITYSSNTNTPTYTLTSIHGCDSTVNLNLTIHQIVNTIDYVSACNSFTWINGITYTQSTNSPTYTLNSIYGCDSIVNLNLTMNYSSSGVDNQVHCKTYTWINGITYTSSTNTPTYTFTNFSGCDSIVRLNLRINPLPNVGITGNMDIFEGDTTELRASGANYYSWSNGLIGQTIFVSPTQTTQYSVAGADENNCTNTASITINVHPPIGLNNIENTNLISIYPNPTSGKINIIYKSNESSMQKIILLNVLGEKIVEKTIKNENEIFLDLSPYSSNIIFMEILLSNGEKFVKKIIKK